MATRLSHESTLPHTRRKIDRHRTPAHESARYRLRKMEVGSRLGMSSRPQNMDLDSSADSSVDSFWWHHHFRPPNRSKFWLLELPSDPVQHAVRSCPDYCYAGRCLCGYALEGQVAVLSCIVRASYHRVVDLAQRVADPSNRGVLLFAYYITSVYPAISPMIYSWSGQNTGGDTKRKVTTGVLFIGASAGNIIGPHLYTPEEAPRYYRGIRSNLALFVVIIVLVGVGALYITYLNKRHAAARERVGKSAHVVDLSMAKSSKLAGEDGVAMNDGKAAGGVGDKAFDDVTDLKNEDFIYVL
jgi:hypothetical protein